MSAPSSTDLRAQDAPPADGAAFNETILASHASHAGHSGHVARASSVLVPPDVVERPRTLADALRDLPLAIQGLWVGLVCIVLLVISAAALRSLAGGGTASSAVPPPSPVPSGSPAATAPILVASPPTAVASAPPIATASDTSFSIGGPSQAAGIGGFGVLSIRDRLPTHIRLRHIGAFLDDLDRLLEVEPSALERADVRKMIADAATYSMAPTLAGTLPPDGERIFIFLSTRAGSAGPDILFELYTTRGGARAATYAEELLKSPELRAKGTPAFQIAYDLRVAGTCKERMELFERAKSFGDKRVLQALFQMARCGKGATDCCLANDPGYKEVVRVINAKR